MKPVLFFLLLVLGFAACSPENVTVDDTLGQQFRDRQVDGCFAIMDNKNGSFTLYNIERYRDSAFQPAGSFHVVASLMGLQTGVIRDVNVPLSDSGQQAAGSAMSEAFRKSDESYYADLTRRLGRDTLQKFLDTLSYGTKKITGPIDAFWRDNSLRITPDEQLGLMKRLYFNELPFFRSNQEAVKKLMLREDKPEYKLSYVTGTGYSGAGYTGLVDWTAGWIEESGHPYFFVLQFGSAQKVDEANLRTQLLSGLLGQLGFMKGKK